MNTAPPLSLYIHFPWCVKKCPYCDFNSHTLRQSLPEKEYIQHLLLNLEQWLPQIQEREIISIFFGGGTPSLLSPAAFEALLKGLNKKLTLASDIEVTMEANPGTIEQSKFQGYFDIGVNRISLGIQSFNDTQLERLGRIHDARQAVSAIEAIKKAGFKNFNLDLMYGLPQQTQEEAMTDIHTALSFQPPHLSWYQLTLEPNTYFYKHPPKLPPEQSMLEIESSGLSQLEAAGFSRYEISAFSQNKPCRHNLNYWQFGDYLALGAGAHGKITNPETQEIIRFDNYRNPKQYMDHTKPYQRNHQVVDAKELAFEYMLNTLRLTQGTPLSEFEQRTFQPIHSIAPKIKQAVDKKLLYPDALLLRATPLGLNYLNDLTLLFFSNE
tara:strand:+ start:18450 stop:19595 length:1146 start_codon:yes stop_codon:yes gene_type:complete